MTKVLIIAEAGVNHNGNIEIAKKMAIAAKNAGADIVKFQTAIPELVMSKNAPKAEYQKVTTGANESQLEMAKKIHLPLSDYEYLKNYCEQEVGIKFLSTPFDHPSIECLDSLGMDIFKIPSGEITNKPYLEKVGALKKQVIISTGMSFLWEIQRAVETIVSAGTLLENISILHCTSQYPAPFNDLNLKAIETLREHFPKCKIGYSDHSNGIEASIAAVALGSKIIEKHFTLDKSMEGPDHKASLDPMELKALVSAIRNIELALGDGIKEPKGKEYEVKEIARRSIHSLKFIPKGKTIEIDDLVMKRPENGISPFDINTVLGKTAKVDIQEDEMLNSEMFL